MKNDLQRDPEGSDPSASALLLSLLQAARVDQPSQAQLARVAEGLPLRDAASSGGRRRVARRLSLVAAACVLLGIGAVAVVAVTWSSPRPTGHSASVASASAFSTGAPITREPLVTPELEARASTPPTVEAAPVMPAGASSARPLVAILRSKAPATVKQLPEAEAAPALLPISTPSVAPTPTPPARPEALDAGSSAQKTEGNLLNEAAVMLDLSPAQALRLTHEHLAAFPSGALSEQREVLAIKALTQLGRAQEARARAARFRQQYPDSKHLHTVEGIIAR